MPDDFTKTRYEPIGEGKILVRAMTNKRMFEQTLQRNSEAVEEMLRETLSGDECAKVMAIGQFILSGMSLTESFTLTFISNDEYNNIRDKSDAVGKYIDFVSMVYKAELTRTLTGAALAGSDKIAGWLMERKYAGEYSAKSVGDMSADKRAHVLEEGVRFVQMNGDSKPLIPERSEEHGE